jgi:hypothetical protein
MTEAKPVTISKQAARAFLVARQGFLGHKGKSGTLAAVRQRERVQIDPVRVIHPNQHLVLHNRVIDYTPSFLETLLYKDRTVFEYWCNEKSIVPTAEFRYFRYRMQNYMDFHSPFYERLKARQDELEDVIHQIFSTIKAQGATCAKDFQEQGIRRKIATRVLNLLWDRGEVMIHHVEGNRRYYDLTDRILPENLNKQAPNREQYERFMINKYMKASGLIDVRDWRFGWLTLKSAQRKAIVQNMAKQGKLHPVRIRGVKHAYYLLDEHLATLEDIKRDPLNSEALYFIAPLDNLIANRRMISELFDFDYAWEIYKPPEKRTYGYYVLPILCGSEFVGRIDPKLDRKSETLVINSLLLEKSFDENFITPLTTALERFLRFHDVSQARILKTKPRQLKDTLLATLN